MVQQRRATIDDLYQVEGKAELVDGEIVLMSPTGEMPGRASGNIFFRLREYERGSQAGRAYPDNVGFRVDLPHRESFSPDVAFHTGDVTSIGMKFIEGAPVFAVEVRSEGDYGRAAEIRMAQKRADYFAAGTLVVWDVDLLSDDVVKVYRVTDPEHPTVYRHGDDAEAEPAVPDWRMSVEEILE